MSPVIALGRKPPNQQCADICYNTVCVVRRRFGPVFGEEIRTTRADSFNTRVTPKGLVLRDSGANPDWIQVRL